MVLASDLIPTDIPGLIAQLGALGFLIKIMYDKLNAIEASLKKLPCKQVDDEGNSKPCGNIKKHCKACAGFSKVK